VVLLLSFGDSGSSASSAPPEALLYCCEISAPGFVVGLDFLVVCVPEPELYLK